MGVAVGVAGTMLPDLGSFRMAPTREEPVIAPGSYIGPTGSVSAPPASQATPVRRIYPYSIIPGGAADGAELARVIKSDFVVAAHYAGFDVANARAVTVTQPRAVYVSYRKGDQVYWTRKKVMLAQGETLLSDGNNEMRARCANRISDVPMFPVETHGPSEAELDTVLAAADGQLMSVAAAMGEADGGMPGQGFQTASFANGAGLLTPIDTSPLVRNTPSVPGAQGLPNSPVSYGGRLTPEGTDTPTPTPPVTSNPPANPPANPPVTPDPPAVPPVTPDPPVVPPVTPDPPVVPPVTPEPPTVPPVTPEPPTVPPVTPEPPVKPPVTPDPPVKPPVTPEPPVKPPVTPEPPTVPPVTPEPPTLPPVTPEPPLLPPEPPVIDPPVVIPPPPSEIPEPGTLWLGGAALAAMLWLRRKGPRAAR